MPDQKNRENTGKVGKNNPPLHTRFRPGKTGNPKGRPEGSKNRSTIFKKWLDIASKINDIETGKEVDGTVEDKIAIGLIKKAIDGDVSAAKEILDSVYGKVADKIKHSGDVEEPIIFKLDERFLNGG